MILPQSVSLTEVSITNPKTPLKRKYAIYFHKS